MTKRSVCKAALLCLLLLAAGLLLLAGVPAAGSAGDLPSAQIAGATSAGVDVVPVALIVLLGASAGLAGRPTPEFSATFRAPAAPKAEAAFVHSDERPDVAACVAPSVESTPYAHANAIAPFPRSSDEAPAGLARITAQPRAPPASS